uniref:cold and drought-regulated protein CORA-like n=1 Tax=Fragaria vesca subsp. vesca TaxID=101020 RepID=UPI0005C84EE4|nr:PREDICTED: cold and drought-regulated protein CORA-like [Fragaria vesca subsp. vesca]
MEKAKAMLIVTLLLVTFLVGSEAGREMMKPKEEVYNPNWLWGWGHFWPWWWWGLHPWLGALDHGLKDAPHGYGGKGELPYSHNKGNGGGNGGGDGNGEKGDTPDHGGDGHNGDGGKYP